MDIGIILELVDNLGPVLNQTVYDKAIETALFQTNLQVMKCFTEFRKDDNLLCAVLEDLVDNLHQFIYLAV